MFNCLSNLSSVIPLQCSKSFFFWIFFSLLSAWCKIVWIKFMLCSTCFVSFLFCMRFSVFYFAVGMFLSYFVSFISMFLSDLKLGHFFFLYFRFGFLAQFLYLYFCTSRNHFYMKHQMDVSFSVRKRFFFFWTEQDRIKVRCGRTAVNDVVCCCCFRFAALARPHLSLACPTIGPKLHSPIKMAAPCNTH